MAAAKGTMALVNVITWPADTESHGSFISLKHGSMRSTIALPPSKSPTPQADLTAICTALNKLTSYSIRTVTTIILKNNATDIPDDPAGKRASYTIKLGSYSESDTSKYQHSDVVIPEFSPQIGSVETQEEIETALATIAEASGKNVFTDGYFVVEG